MKKTRRTDRPEWDAQGNGSSGPSANGELSDQGREEFVCCVREEIRAMVGGHCYFILVKEECAQLCRVPFLEQERTCHEVVDHAQHGISDDDLEHALRMLGAHISQPGYYRISGHIEGKLRALLDA